MSRKTTAWLAGIACTVLAGAAQGAVAANEDAIGFERTPPRLSFTDGAVSFSRAGAGDWTPAAVNTALAPGDQLYTGQAANLEVQIGARAYVRAGEQTQLGLENLEPDFLQLRVAAGHVSLDLRSLTAGQTIELDTPGAAFTIEHTGYYRLEIAGETTTFTSRRGGRASMTPGVGAPALIAPSELVVISGGDAPQIETYAAPELDAWDRWNYARTDDQIDAVSARYVPPGVYGADQLDQYGDWRLVPTYGAVWVPRSVAPGWAPYSTGRWMFDPYYGWTWVDAAPWGWAPYHYGRWVHVSGHWGWCPGPVVARATYAPALVAFFGGGGLSIGFSVGSPYLGWVALGWGEPLVPWWGPAGFRGQPRWAGWGGPRVVNNVVVNRTTVIHVKDIHVYQNAHVHDAIVEVDRKHFGHRTGDEVHYVRGDPAKLEPIHGDPGVKPDRSSLSAEARHAARPPHEAISRPVVATREPRGERPDDLELPGRGHAGRGGEASAADDAPPARVVKPPREGKRVAATERPPFGRGGDAERQIPPPAPRFQDAARAESKHAPPTPTRPSEQATASEGTPAVPAPAGRREARGRRGPAPQSPAPVAELPGRSRSEAAPAQHETASKEASTLPGEPANRVYRRSAPPASRADVAPRTQAPRSSSSPGAASSRAVREPRAAKAHGHQLERGAASPAE